MILSQNQGVDVFVDTMNNVVAATQPTEAKLSVLDLAISGGWIMLVLAILSIIAVYIFIERWITLHKANKSDKHFMTMIRDYIHDGKIKEAKALCNAKDTPISRMVGKGISRLGRPLSDIQQTIENEGNLEVSRLEKNLYLMATISSAAPMIGFLGTVIGMIQSFYDMSVAGNNVNLEILSSGIYLALVTTVGGLIVGIIAYACYNILVSRVDKMVFKLESTATEFMDLLNEPVA